MRSQQHKPQADKVEWRTVVGLTTRSEVSVFGLTIIRRAKEARIEQAMYGTASQRVVPDWRRWLKVVVSLLMLSLAILGAWPTIQQLIK